MFHYINGELKREQNIIYITNGLIGIQAFYFGNKNKGEFFLHPHLDDNKKTIIYFAFDTSEQKITFEEILKVNGVGPKTAFQIVQLPKDKLDMAIKTLDAKFFQSIPGIGPKSAKKILLELKGNFEFDDIQKMDIDQKLYKNIISSMRGLGYDTSSIKSTLKKYDGKITKENTSEVIKRVISQI
ncbi:MAG TPA: Holliday junction branch migration protein RuvA [Candidatus Absconditabacterales bacterium]|nr:Holliday junction branch migration protein RuvA [Candidatus Absconditabacterales bacterium]